MPDDLGGDARHLFLGAYLLYPSGHFAGAWRHPYSETDFNDVGLFRDAARTLERAKFDLAFIPETVSYREAFTRHGLSNGIKHDPAQLAAQVASVTTHLGVGVTLSTSFNEPYNLARTLQSLDLLSGGRVAWNIIQSQGAANFRNFPNVAELGRDATYDRGDEFVEAVLRLWRSWDADALVADKASGIFVDTSRVTVPEYAGHHVRVAGPINLPPSPQRHPVLLQAGDSPRGREFGAKWGDVIFAIELNADELRAKKADIQSRAQAIGRDPDEIRLFAAVQPIIGETTAIAHARRDFLRELVSPAAGIEFFSLFARLDLSDVAPEEPFRKVIDERTTPEQRASRAIAGLEDLLGARARTATIADAAIAFSQSELTPQIVGTGREVAEQIAEIFLGGAADGFLVTPTHFPGSFDEFARAVVPELQALGVFKREYAGTSLRDNLGLR